jgi:hypothetical protein
MKLPLAKLGMVDVDLKNIPRKAWIILAYALLILATGMAVALARWGKVVIVTPHGTYDKVRAVDMLYKGDKP